MSGSRVLCFGDIANDVVVAPRAEIRPDTDTLSNIRQTPGGSAANTAAWLGVLGAPVDLVACVGSLDGERHADLLRRQGVVPHLQVATGLETSTIVIVVEGEGRTMLTDRGANRALSDDHVLWTCENCHITPHTAGGQFEESRVLIRHFLENLRRHEKGEALVNRIM